MKKQTRDLGAEEGQAGANVAQAVTIEVQDGKRVSGLLQRSEGKSVCYLIAHGAGAGMRHPFLEDMAKRFATSQIDTLRYQFPYMEQGTKRPDPPKLAQA